MPRLIAALALMLATAFLATIVWAAMEKGLFEGFGLVLAERWGVVGIADLYLGFLVIAGWMAACERRVSSAVAWIVGLFLLGNLITLLYVAVRAWRASTWREVFVPARTPTA